MGRSSEQLRPNLTVLLSPPSLTSNSPRPGRESFSTPSPSAWRPQYRPIHQIACPKMLGLPYSQAPITSNLDATNQQNSLRDRRSLAVPCRPRHLASRELPAGRLPRSGRSDVNEDGSTPYLHSQPPRSRTPPPTPSRPSSRRSRCSSTRSIHQAPVGLCLLFPSPLSPPLPLSPLSHDISHPRYVERSTVAPLGNPPWWCGGVDPCSGWDSC